MLDSYGNNEALKSYAQESISVFKEAYPHQLKDAAFFLELALWKSTIDESSMKSHNSEEGGTATDMRAKYRINCGADIIIPNVLPFLNGLHGVELKPNLQSFCRSPVLTNCTGLFAYI